MKLTRDVSLASLTTIHLGGRARYLARCASLADVREALRLAQAQALPCHVLGGGSNTIFGDDGFAGLVLKINLSGLQFSLSGDEVEVTAAAGEPWDQLVASTVERGWAGFECLAGIPGLVGATPLQNVGAYGQEVAQTLTQVTALERTTLKEISFRNIECQFGYRTSRFKNADRDRYIITSVTYRLRRDGPPTLTYPQLVEALAHGPALTRLPPGREQLTAVREAVLKLRRGKSMVLDHVDPHTTSCGSFFVNPQLAAPELTALTERWQGLGGRGAVPTFVDSAAGERRVPAAWLIEQAGFPKGLRAGGVGISARHNLALVNYGGTTRELLGLAARITAAVREKFGVSLVREPVVVK